MCTPKLSQPALALWLIAPFALVLLAGCAGQRTTPTSAVSVHKSPQTTPRETQPTSRRTGIAPKEVGYYLDALQGRLLQEVPKDVGVARQGERIAVELPTAADASWLLRTLQSIANVLIEYRLVRVTLRSAPASGETETVAESRVHDAARALMRRGVSAGRISVAGGMPAGAAAHVELLLEPIVQSDGQHAGH